MNVEHPELVFTDHSYEQENHHDFQSHIYKYALENSNIGVWEWDIISNKIYHSNILKAIYGYNNIEIDWKDRIHSDDLEELTVLVNNHLEGKTIEYRSEHRIRCNDGSYKWVLDCGKIISHDSQNNPTRFIGTTSDISKRKECEEEQFQNLTVITNQNNKLANFAHIVTHNLKVYAGNFESLLNFYDESNSNEEKNGLITYLRTVSDSLTSTINNLKSIVSKQLNRNVECKYLKFNEFVCKVEKQLELEMANKKAVIINNISDDLYLFSNEAYLESIFFNLASNALKYSHPDRNPLIIIDSFINESEIIITITDNGIGIDLEKYGNDVFGLYNTFHGNDNAEGIGLHITKNQIETLGGTIHIESKVNVGTTFTISIKQKKSS